MVSTPTSHATMLVFLAAAARAGLIAADAVWARLLFPERRHDRGGRITVVPQLRTRAHRRRDVCEELPIARAQVIESRLGIRRRDEAVLGAAAVASEQDGALTTVAGQGVPVVLPALALERGP